MLCALSKKSNARRKRSYSIVVELRRVDRRERNVVLACARVEPRIDRDGRFVTFVVSCFSRKSSRVRTWNREKVVCTDFPSFIVDKRLEVQPESLSKCKTEPHVKSKRVSRFRDRTCWDIKRKRPRVVSHMFHGNALRPAEAECIACFH